jgi:hypothetical protein
MMALAVIILVIYPLILKIFAKKSWKEFFKAAFPVQMLAFSTSSSAATLPLTMERTQKELGVSEEVSNFVLPVGVTINMDGTSCYQAVAAVFLAQVLGLDLTFGQMLLILATATISSIGTPGIPGGSIVMLMIVLDSVGIPIEGLALILGIDILVAQRVAKGSYLLLQTVLRHHQGKLDTPLRLLGTAGEDMVDHSTTEADDGSTLTIGILYVVDILGCLYAFLFYPSLDGFAESRNIQ